MKTYYIYHIPGIKIGCTSDLDKRIKDQGFTNYEILETHNDGWFAGDRELELQKEYGYPIDTIHYMISVQNRIQSVENCSRGGIKGGNTNKTSGHIQTIQKIGCKLGGLASSKVGGPSKGGKKGGPKGGKVAMSIERTCDICNRTIKGAGYFTHYNACSRNKKT